MKAWLCTNSTSAHLLEQYCRNKMAEEGLKCKRIKFIVKDGGNIMASQNYASNFNSASHDFT